MSLLRSPARAALALLTVASVALLAGCGDDGEPTGGASPSTTSETTTAATTEPPRAEINLEVTVAGGAVTSSEDSVSVTAGDTVIATITSDITDVVHAHGVDEFLNVVPGETGTLRFRVRNWVQPGVYEVEMHGSGLQLFQLEVR